MEKSSRSQGFYLRREIVTTHYEVIWCQVKTRGSTEQRALPRAEVRVTSPALLVADLPDALMRAQL